jgi:hypothetical protein
MRLDETCQQVIDEISLEAAADARPAPRQKARALAAAEA